MLWQHDNPESVAAALSGTEVELQRVKFDVGMFWSSYNDGSVRIKLLHVNSLILCLKSLIKPFTICFTTGTVLFYFSFLLRVCKPIRSLHEPQLSSMEFKDAALLYFDERCLSVFIKG